MANVKFSNIKVIPRTSYKIDVDWNFLCRCLADYAKNYKLELNPDFQRGHIWTEDQQSRYVEFILRDGLTGRNIYFNCPGWNYGDIGTLQCVDGLQRLTAAIRFINNEIKAFGYYKQEYFEEKIPRRASFAFWVNDLENRNDILQWYLDLNRGATPHTKEELTRVEKLKNKENK